MPEIKFKRGLKSKLPTLDVAEPAFTTDTEEFFIGSADGNIQFAKQSDLDETNSTKADQTSLDITNANVTNNTNTLNNLANVNANAEVMSARGTYPLLGNRLDNTDTLLAERALQTDLDATNQNVSANTTTITTNSTKIGDIAQLNTTDKTSVVNAIKEIKTQANNLASGSPKGIYTTISALQSAFPTGTTGIYLVTGNVKEVDNLTITAVPTAAGNVTVTLNGVAVNIAVDPATDTTTSAVATKIRNTAFSGWTTGGTGATVTFTATAVGTKTTPVYSTASTGATGTMSVTTAGANSDGNWYYWNGSAWVAGGIYQATGLAPGSVTPTEMANGAVTSQKLDINVYNSIYTNIDPFDKKSTFKIGTNDYTSKITNTIKDIFITGSFDINKTYFIKAIYRKKFLTSSLPQRYYIVLSEYDPVATTTRDVAQLQSDNYTEQVGISSVALTSINNSGISATIYMDWSGLILGDAIFTFDQTGTPISKNKLVLRTDPSVLSRLSTVENKVVTDYLPFSKAATFILNSIDYTQTLLNTIKGLSLTGAIDTNKKYFLKAIYRNKNMSTSFPHRYYILIGEYDPIANTSREVCQFTSDTYTESTGSVTIDLTALNSSAITGKITVIWSGMTDNTALYYFDQNSALFDKSGLSSAGGSGGSIASVSVNVPSVINTVIGDTIEIFYDSIIKSVLPKRYSVDFNAAKGANKGRKWVYTPSAGDTDFTATVLVRDDNLNIVGQKSVTIKVNAKKTSPVSAKNTLLVGDSLTAGGEYAAELKRRLTASGGTPSGDALTNINFIGTATGYAVGGVSFEGYGGWTINSYLSAPSSADSSDVWVTVTSGLKDLATSQESLWKDSNNNQWQLESINGSKIMFKHYPIGTTGYTMPTSGTLTFVSGGGDQTAIQYNGTTIANSNPFWSTSQSKVSFTDYCSRNGFSGIDYVVILLGWNNIITNSDINSVMASTKQFLDQLKADFPNVKVILCGLQMPCGFGALGYYGSQDLISNEYLTRCKVFDYNDTYESIAKDTNYSAFVSFLNIASQFDSEYNMQYGTANVNNRNTATEKVGLNGVHPATAGYMQIADAAYRQMVNIL